MRRIIFFLLFISPKLLIGQLNQTLPYKETEDSEFTFAFLTDIHLTYGRDAVKYFNKVIDTVNSLSPDFVLTGGDLVMDALDASYSGADSLYNLYLSASGNFEMPVYNTIGNHELFGVYAKEKIDTGHTDYGKRMYEKRIGKRYYTFEHKGWKFFSLDGIKITDERDYIGEIDQVQMEWIKSELEKTPLEMPIVICSHIPFVTSQTQLKKGALASNDSYLIITNSTDVLGLFKMYNLKLVLQGHLHFLEDINVLNKTHFLTGGAVCGYWWNYYPERPLRPGFVILKFDNEEIEWNYVDYGWQPPESGNN